MNFKIPFSVVDVETTGAIHGQDRVIEVGAVKVFQGEVIEWFSSFVNPARPIPPFVARMTGISNEKVASAPRFREIAGELHGFLQNTIFVGHNAIFDYKFLSKEFVDAKFAPLDMPMLCTLKLARKIFPGMRYYNLPDLCKTLKIRHDQAHSAKFDSMATASLLMRIIKKASSENVSIMV